MANADNPNGFTPFSANPRVNSYQAGGTIAKGDMLMYSSGKVVVHDNSNALCAGVAAQSGGSNEFVAVYDDADTVFIGQVDSATDHAQGTHDGALAGLVGVSGAKEIDLDGGSGTVRVLRQEFIPGSMETGAHARVLFTIAEHVNGSSGRVS